MPYQIQPDPEHEGRKRVVNIDTSEVHGSNQDADTALSQFRLLEGIEHGWKPDGSQAGDGKPGRHYGNKS